MVNIGANSDTRYPFWTLLAILLFYTLLKAPYLAVPFTGDHSLKYTTYVEPAFHMAERGNPLWYQQKYTADPVFNPEGRKERFNHLPLLEWGLFLAYKALPIKSLQLKTRIVTHLVGLGILLLAYALYSQWVPKSLALLSTFLMSINPVFVFSTFVTVQDAPAILLTFLSLLLLTRYFEGNEPTWLFWAGVVFGAGVSVKYSMFLWMAPISLVIIYFRARDAQEFLYTSFILFFLGLIEIVAVRTSVNILPTSLGKGLLLLAIWLSAYAAFWYGMTRMNARILETFRSLVRNRMMLYPLILTGIAALLLLFRYFNLFGYANYLTDMSLLTNPKLYKYMLWGQFRGYMTENVFWFSLAGLLLALIQDNKPVRWLALSLCLGSAVYWIAASKAMFFHSYYTMILMITASFLAAVTIYCIVRSARSTSEKLVIGFLVAALIVPGSYRAATARISKHQDVSSAIEFIRNNTSVGDWIIYDGWYLMPLVLYTDSAFVRPYRLNNDQIKGDIKRIGFSGTMKKYRIRYFMTSKKNSAFLDFAPLFAETKVKRPSYDRDYLIEKRLGTVPKETREAFSELEQVAQDHRIQDKFRLEAKKGSLRFYSFQDGARNDL